MQLINSAECALTGNKWQQMRNAVAVKGDLALLIAVFMEIAGYWQTNYLVISSSEIVTKVLMQTN